MHLFQAGDRVTSTFAGLCSGLPGTIIKRSMIQQGKSSRYIVKFDNGKSLALWETDLKNI